MLGSDRFVIGAIIVCLGLAGLAVFQSNRSQQQQYPAYRYASDKPLEVDATLPIIRSAEALADRTPCQNPKGKDESDLCAQWRAARAAEDSAFWAQWGFWIAVCGTGALLWQIMLTRIAVEDTGKATEAMNESNSITRKQMRRELMKTRPVVRVVPGARIYAVDQQWLNTMSDEDRARSCYFSCRIENTGKSDCWVEDSWIKFEYVTSQIGMSNNTRYTNFRLGTNVPLSVGEHYDFENHIYLLPLDIKEKIYNGEGFFRGYIVYRDNDTNTRFGATFGYRLEVAIGGLVADKRTNERLDWQDGIVQSVELERYGHIHFTP